MEKLTEKMRKEYVEYDGYNCPYCGSEYIEGGEIDYEGNHHFQNIKCSSCKKEWTDIYTLTSIEPFNNNGE
jgi:transposase-like protein